MERQVVRNLEAEIDRCLDEAYLPASDDPADDYLGKHNRVELVSTRLEQMRSGQENDDLGAVVLPPGSAPDALRWLVPGLEPPPRDALPWLDLPRDADWPTVVRAALEHFPGHWAGLAYYA